VWIKGISGYMEKRIIEMNGEKEAKGVWILRQSVEANMREERSLVFYSKLISNWEMKSYM
jgi:hypothetical protein